MKKKLTKKQIALNKKIRHQKSKKYLEHQERIRIKKRFAEWSKDIRKYEKCLICETTEGLNAHHIIPREIKETRFDLLNGIALCAKKHHKFGIYSVHMNPLWIHEVLKLKRPNQYNYIRKKALNLGYKHGENA